MAKEEQVPVYYIGVHFKTASRRPVFNVKGVPYSAPKEIGQHIMVNPNDVQELIEKSRADIRNKGAVETFTTSADMAARVVESLKSGSDLVVPVRVTVQDAMQMITPEMLKERVIAELPVEELEEMLRMMKPELETAEAVEREILEPVEELKGYANAIDVPVEEQKKKPGRPRKKDGVVKFDNSEQE